MKIELDTRQALDVLDAVRHEIGRNGAEAAAWDKEAQRPDDGSPKNPNAIENAEYYRKHSETLQTVMEMLDKGLRS